MSAGQHLITYAHRFSEIHALVLSRHYLVLNLEKTDAILLATRQQLKKSTLTQLSINGMLIPMAKYVRNLGIILDPSLTFELHISSVCRAAFNHLCLIARLNKSMTIAHRFSAIHALVLFRLDYCAPLFYGLDDKFT